MEKKTKKPHLDLNELAAAIVNEATEEKSAEETPPDESQPAIPADGKNPNAVALGRLGGLKGGPARKKMLSKERRSEIAHNAAQARWNKQQ